MCVCVFVCLSEKMHNAHCTVGSLLMFLFIYLFIFLTGVQKHCCCMFCFFFCFFFSLSCCIDAAPVQNVIRELGIPKTICGRWGSIQLTSRPCNPLIILVGSEKNSVWRDTKLCAGLIRETAFTMFVFFKMIFPPLPLKSTDGEHFLYDLC